MINTTYAIENFGVFEDKFGFYIILDCLKNGHSVGRQVDFKHISKYFPENITFAQLQNTDISDDGQGIIFYEFDLELRLSQLININR